ncbi:MAG: adenylate/guanylate cyclase domain-containing protein [Leptospirales bacterium]
MPESFDIILSHTPRILQEKMQNQVSSPIAPMLDETEAAILFCDIAGFSKLTDKITSKNAGGIDELVEILDAYIGLMVDMIMDFDGDIVKFAGDALFAIWPVSKSNNLEKVLAQAMKCGLELKDKANRFSIKGQTLDVRIALGGGPFTVYYVGGIFGRWELLLTGEAMNQVARAGGLAQAGEMVIAKELQTILALFYSTSKMESAETLSLEMDDNQLKSISPVPVTETLIEPYTARVSAEIKPTCEPALRAYLPRAILTEIDENTTPHLADYRPVSVIFLKVLGLNFVKSYNLEYVNDIMQIMQRCLYQFKGSINRFGFDDKGAVLLAAFGLPPLVHENDPYRAVKAAIKFRDRFKKNDLECVIGIGTGPVFCGTVGSSRRSEYTMHGTIVNMAAALMQASQSILCDQTTYDDTRNDFEYKIATPVNIKSQKEPVAVYTPLYSSS